ncbi:MAG: hypothetical protein K6A29_04205 [Lachnospiraceae bacterium]|nr:hypothetical protein [Lachnospiraceae bacterium]
MNYIDYFKSQAKKFYKDFQTQYVAEGDIVYSYQPKFWSDINGIIVDYDVDEDNFSLMKAQHLIANLANFGSWNELIHANDYLQEIGYYLIEHREDDFLSRWQWYEPYAELDRFDDVTKLDIFKHVFLNMEE